MIEKSLKIKNTRLWEEINKMVVIYLLVVLLMVLLFIGLIAFAMISMLSLIFDGIPEFLNWLIKNEKKGD